MNGLRCVGSPCPPILKGTCIDADEPAMTGKEGEVMTITLASTEGLPHAKWLEYRRMGIGGSDASVVCGINKYKSPIELFMEKTGRTPHREAGEAAYWGVRLEPLVRDEFTLRTGLEVSHLKRILQSGEHPFMLANLDGVVECPEHGACVFEAKTAGAYLLGDWEEGVPDAYTLQVQHYMAVTGYKGAYIAALIGGNTFKWRFVKRDEELIAMLVELEAGFWELVQTDTPPPPDGSEACARFMGETFPNSVSAGIELPKDAAALIRRYDAACEQMEASAERKRLAENLLKGMLGECECGRSGDRYVNWKTVCQERLDSKAFKAKHPKLYRKYVNKTSHRRFSISAAM